MCVPAWYQLGSKWLGTWKIHVHWDLPFLEIRCVSKPIPLSQKFRRTSGNANFAWIFVSLNKFAAWHLAVMVKNSLKKERDNRTRVLTYCFPELSRVFQKQRYVREPKIWNVFLSLLCFCFPAGLCFVVCLEFLLQYIFNYDGQTYAVSVSYIIIKSRLQISRNIVINVFVAICWCKCKRRGYKTNWLQRQFTDDPWELCDSFGQNRY